MTFLPVSTLVGALLLACPQGSSSPEGHPKQPPGQPWEQLWLQGERVAAVDALAEALAAEPDREDLRLSLAEREVAIHRYGAALAHAEPLGADDPRVASLRGVALHRLGRYVEALEHLDRTRPEHALRVLDCLETLGREEELASALDVAAEALGADHPEVHAWRGRALARADRHAEAVAEFRAALRGDGVLLAAHFGLGQSLLRLGRRDEAVEALERHRELVPLIDELDFARQGLDLAPLHAPNHAQLGDVERALGRLDRAEAAYVRAESYARPDELASIALRHARLLDEDRGDLDGALRVLTNAGQFSGDPRLPVRAGDLLLARGRAREAVTRFQSALRLRPNDAAILERIERAQRAARDE